MNHLRVETFHWKKKIIKIGEAVAAGGTGEENLLSFYMCIDGF